MRLTLGGTYRRRGGWGKGQQGPGCEDLEFQIGKQGLYFILQVGLGNR